LKISHQGLLPALAMPACGFRYNNCKTLLKCRPLGPSWAAFYIWDRGKLHCVVWLRHHAAEMATLGCCGAGSALW
jgi:hypothetical protein